jgi:hypothetical protein
VKRAPHSPQSLNGKAVSAVDWLGNRFAIGDTVVYCISAGRGQMMAIGEVVQIKVEQKFTRSQVPADADDPDAVQYYDSVEYYRTVQHPYDEITVQVRTLKTSGRWDNKERSKPAWVNPMNITSFRNVGTA